MDERFLTDISITKTAKSRIDELKNDNKDVFVRIMIASGGCAGKRYYILMDDYIGDNDFVLNEEFMGEKLPYIVIDDDSLSLLHNSVIDYEEGLEFSGFKIDNPNVKALCDCGNSFNCDGSLIEKQAECTKNDS